MAELLPKFDDWRCPRCATEGRDRRTLRFNFHGLMVRDGILDFSRATEISAECATCDAPAATFIRGKGWVTLHLASINGTETEHGSID